MKRGLSLPRSKWAGTAHRKFQQLGCGPRLVVFCGLHDRRAAACSAGDLAGKLQNDVVTGPSRIV